MYYNQYYRNYTNPNSNNRFVTGGLLAPLLVGGIAGYAIGNNNYKPYATPYGQPYYYYPVYYPYNNYYYYY